MEMKRYVNTQEFNRLYKELGRLYYEVSFQTGISDSAFWIMYSIAELGDGCLQKNIAETHFISKQTISSAVRSLEKKGYINLQRGKGRSMHLHLTEAGKVFVHEKIETLMEIENSVFEEMTLAENKELLRLSQKYNDIFKDKIANLLKQGK